jgi:hypothetical protein
MKPLPATLLLVVLAMVFVAMVFGGFHRDELEEGGNSDSGSPNRTSPAERQGAVPSKASTRVVGASSELQPKDPISVHVKDFRAARSRFEGRERYERTLESFKLARANLSGVQLIRFVNEVEEECPEELREWLSNSVSQKVMAMPEDRKDVGDFLENNGISKRLAFAIGIEAGASKYEVSSRYANAIKEKDSRREFMVGYQMMFYRFDPVAAVENIVDSSRLSLLISIGIIIWS